MAHVIGTVKSIHGKAAVKKVNDHLETLKVGDVLHENEMVYALGADSNVTLDLEGGRTLHLNGYDEVLLDSSVFAALDKGESLDVDALRQAIAEGADLTKAGETAAGNEVVGESNAGADLAVRGDGRGDVSSYLTGTDSSPFGVTLTPDSLHAQAETIQNVIPKTFEDVSVVVENVAPKAFDEVGVAVEEGSGREGQYNAPVVAIGNIVENDTDDGLPVPENLDVIGITSNDAANAATLVDGNFIIVGKYGTLIINSETGAYTYMVNDGNLDVDKLNVNGSVTESFNYIVSDGSLSDEGLLTITINGTNDAPVAIADSNTVTEAAGWHEAGHPIAVGNVITDPLTGDHDVDNTELAVVSVQGGHNFFNSFVVVGEYGVLTMKSDGTYFYVLNNFNHDVNALNNSSDPLTDTFTYTISDNESTGAKTDLTTLTITINGTNDAPVAHADYNSVTEAGWHDFGDPIAAGNVIANDHDVDNTNLSVVGVQGGHNFFNGFIVNGQYGVLYINKDGSYTYILNNFNHDVNALPDGGHLRENFTYTISDNEETGAKTDSTTLRIMINGTNDAPTIQHDFVALHLSEEGLTGGIADTVPHHYDTTDATHIEGTMKFGDIDTGDTLSVHLAAPTVPMTSGGMTITWLGAGTDTLTGSANGSGVITITVTNTGHYDVTLNRPLDHPINSAEDNLSFGVHVTVTDAHGASDNANLAITIEDDMPRVSDISTSVAEESISAAQDNVVLILDRSGSMSSSIVSVKEGVQNLLDSGHVHAVFIASFAKGGSVENDGQWYDVTTHAGVVAAMSAVDHVYSSAYSGNSGGTDYDAALAAVMNHFIAPPTGGDRLISVFMSDGEPNEEHGTIGINSTEEGQWIGFLQGHGFAESYAIGFGAVTPGDSNFLEPIAWTSSEVASTNTTGASDANVIVLNVTDLGDALVGITYTPNTLEGNLLSNAAPGADGWHVVAGEISPVGSATVNGDTHIFTSATDSHSFTLENGAGSVVIYGNGNYIFTGSAADLKDNASGVVTYTLIDADGDNVTGHLTLTTTDSSEVYAYDNENGAQITQEMIPGIPSTHILADFSGTDSTPHGGAYNPWIFDTTSKQNDPSSSVLDGQSNIVGGVNSYNTENWIVSSLNGASLDAKIPSNDERLLIVDNSASWHTAGPAEVLTPLFAVTENGTELKFNYERGNVDDADTVTWQLYKQDGSNWVSVSGAGHAGSLSGATSSVQTVTSALLDTGNYRIYFSVSGGQTNQNTQLYLDNIRLIVPGDDIIQTNITDSTGNVLTDPNTLISSSDAWLTTDDKGSEGAILSIFDGSAYVLAAAAGTTIDGDYGTLVLHSDGSYVYTPDSDAIGQTETFSYMLTQPDGDSDTANLVINISNTDYVATTPIVGVDDGFGNYTYEGTEDNNVILGSIGNDILHGNGGSDHIEGAAGNDILDGGNGNDVLIGGAGDDEMHGGTGNDRLVIDSEDGIIDGGAGYDTVVLSGNHNIDFSNLGTLQISNIEAIDLTNGDHTINNVAAADVLGITDANNILHITGDSGDTVGLVAGDWTAAGTVDGYNVYTATVGGDNITLHIDTDVNVIP